MFIDRGDSATLLCSEERHSFEPTWDRNAALPNRAGGGWLAGYKHCTPPEWSEGERFSGKEGVPFPT